MGELQTGLSETLEVRRQLFYFLHISPAVWQLVRFLQTLRVPTTKEKSPRPALQTSRPAQIITEIGLALLTASMHHVEANALACTQIHKTST